MNVYALITFVAGLIYVSLGFVGLRIDWRARLNQIFFLLCMACAWWSFCIAFMFPAYDYNTAWFLFRWSSLGFCLGPPLILHFVICLITNKNAIVQQWLAWSIYIPGLIFTVIGINHGLTANQLVHKSFGWDNVSATWSTAYWAYVIYYTLCVVVSILLVAAWGLRAKSKKRKRQAVILVVFSVLGLLFASGSEVLPPILGITSFPKIPAVMWLFWAAGAWYAISKYRLLIMTPQIATQAIVSSITDMLLMLDSKGKITIVNQALFTQLGYTAGELIGQPGSIILADQNYISDSLVKMGTSINHDKIKMDYVNKNGDRIPVVLSSSAIRDNFGELVGMVLIAQDLRPTLLLEYQNNELEAISTDLLETNMALGKKSVQIKNILDNVGQGFLTFGPNLLIQSDYSRECTEILGSEPENRTLAELIYSNDDEQKTFLDSLLTKIFAQNSGHKLSLYLPLLPSEVEINGRCINTEYKLVNENNETEASYIITILTDITEKRLLEEKMQEEKKNLRMVVKAIAYYDQFVECIEDYQAFTQNTVYQVLQGPTTSEEKYLELFRAVHTFKGNFSQFETVYIVKRLHQLENALSKQRGKLRATDDAGLAQMFNELEMDSWLDEDLAIINRFLGDDFLQKKDTFTVNKEKLQEIENNMLKILPPKEYTLLLPYVRKLRYKPFKDMLKTYPEYVLQLALRLGKSVNPFNVEGSDVMVDNDFYHFFARSLINVFRNMVDHGIEYMDDRILLGKSEIGNIRCLIEDTADRILLIISDDGAGLDLDRIKEVALMAGLYTEQEIAACTDDQVARLIFEDNFSTSEEISEVSGRGIGLSALKDELERLNGSVQITTGKGIGTTFVFSLPNPHCAAELPNFSQEEIVLAIIQTLKEFSFSHLKQKLNSDYEVIATDRVCLNQYTAMINVRGIVDGTVVISYSESLLTDLVTMFVGSDISLEDRQDLLEDVTAETTNIIIGNSLKKLGPLEDLLTLGTPTVTSNRAATIKHSHAHIYNCSLEKDDYIVTASFVPN